VHDAYADPDWLPSEHGFELTPGAPTLLLPSSRMPPYSRLEAVPGCGSRHGVRSAAQAASSQYQHQSYRPSAAAHCICRMASHVGCSRLLEHEASRHRRPTCKQSLLQWPPGRSGQMPRQCSKVWSHKTSSSAMCCGLLAAERQHVGMLTSPDHQSLAASLASAAPELFADAAKLEEGWQLPNSSHCRPVCAVDMRATLLSSRHTPLPHGGAHSSGGDQW